MRFITGNPCRKDWDCEFTGACLFVLLTAIVDRCSRLSGWCCTLRKNLLELLVRDLPTEAAVAAVLTSEYWFLEPSMLEEEQNRVPPFVKEVLFSRDRI